MELAGTHSRGAAAAMGHVLQSIYVAQMGREDEKERSVREPYTAEREHKMSVP